MRFISNPDTAFSRINDDHAALKLRMVTILRAVQSRETLNDDEIHTATQGLGARLLRGKEENDFATFSDDPDRRIVFTLGPDGIKRLPGLTGYQMLTDVVGTTREYVLNKFGLDETGQPKHKCKLVMFPEKYGALLATWDNVLALVQKAYPNLANHLGNFLPEILPALVSNPFEFFATTFYEKHKTTFAEVEQNGPADPYFMTEERLLARQPSPLDVRAFLYFTVYLKDLYRGDGTTISESGIQGPNEYIMVNQKLTDLPHAIIDIDVEV